MQKIITHRPIQIGTEIVAITYGYLSLLSFTEPER